MVKSKGDMFEEGIIAPNKSRAVNKAKALQLQDDEYDGDGNNEPEEVSSNSEDIRRLRELHEQMMLPADKRTKKRKTRQLPTIEESKKVNDKEKLDDSVLAALDGINENEESRNEPENEDINKSIPKNNTRKGGIDIYAMKSRKMYVLLVGVFDDQHEPISSLAS